MLPSRRRDGMASSIEKDVAFEVHANRVAADITAAYHAKYEQYERAIVGTVVSAQAVASTLLPVPGAGLADVRAGSSGYSGNPSPSQRLWSAIRSIRSHLNE